MTVADAVQAARERSARIDALLRSLSGRLADGPALAMVALGAYGRQELLPRGTADVLFLHTGGVSSRWVTEAVCYPLWERNLRVEPIVRQLADCAADARRSLAAVENLLDARLIAGDAGLYAHLVQQVIVPLRRDRKQLKLRLAADVRRRHQARPAATADALPDLVDGRGGLRDAQVLRWLGVGTQAEAVGGPQVDRVGGAVAFLLRALGALDELEQPTPPRLTAGDQERLAAALGYREPVDFMSDLYGHSRWVAFLLDGVLAPHRDDRQLGAHLAVEDGELVGHGLPHLEAAPKATAPQTALALALRVANLVGFAPPSAQLLDWATSLAARAPEAPPSWDAASLNQLWLLLRAADWRSWEFLDVSGLLPWCLPEVGRLWRTLDRQRVADQALDTHAFLALRLLHDAAASTDAFGQRVWRALRHRDWLYLAVLLHELEPADALACARRLGLPAEACTAIEFGAGNYRRLIDTAIRRDVHDEDAILDLAARVRTRQRLALLYLVAAAHEQAASGWTAWKADLVRQVVVRVEAVLRAADGELGVRRTRTVEHHRDRVAAELDRRGLAELREIVPRLPRRYLLSRSPASVARHLGMLAGQPLGDGEVRLQAHRARQPGIWELLIVARDRPGLLATVAGVLALRGLSVLAADAATCSDGLVLDVFTISDAHGAAIESSRWTHVADDVASALRGRLPLDDLLGVRPIDADPAAVQVQLDNAASQFFSIVEVRAPDHVGLLFRIARALGQVGLDIHHARIATHPEGALDVFYVWDLKGAKLEEERAAAAAAELRRRLTS